MSSVLKATIENKTTSVTTYFEEINKRKQSVYSNCYILQFLHQMFNVSALLLDDPLKPATPLTNARSIKRCDISQGSVATHLRSGGIFIDSIITNFVLILIVKLFRKSVNIC